MFVGGVSFGGGGDGGSNPDRPFYDPPLAASFPTRLVGAGGQITLTDDADVGLLVNGGSSLAGDIQRVALKPLPAGAFAVYCRLAVTQTGGDYQSAGLALRSSATGAIELWRLSNQRTLGLQRLPGLQGYTSDPYNDGFSPMQVFLGLQRTGGGNLRYGLSADGKNWALCYDASQLTHFGQFGPDQIGFGFASNRQTLDAGFNLQMISCDFWDQSWED
jgi:hypothetical protein